MKICILGSDYGFPNGGGAASRVRSITKALSEYSVDIQVILLRPSDKTHLENNQISGRWENVNFIYACKQTERRKTFWQRRITEILGIVQGLSLCKKFNPDIIYFYSPSDFFYNLLGWLYAKFCNCIYVGEFTELPLVYLNNTSPFVKIMKWLNNHIGFYLFDGIVVISSFLEEYFAKYVQRKKQIIRIPILVDTSLYEIKEMVKNPRCGIITYCGNLNHEGEIENLLLAFSEVQKKYKDWILRIIGGASSEKREESLINYAKEIGVYDNVDFTGPIPSKDIPGMLSESNIMALIRQKGEFSTAGFPTKLGEYLATGKPVVVSAVGDIANYLKDEDNAYLVSGDSTIEDFGKKIIAVIENPSKAAEVGKKGRAVAQNEFGIYPNGEKLYAFLNALRMNDQCD